MYVCNYTESKKVHANFFSGKLNKRKLEKVASVKRDDIRGTGDHHMEMVPLPIPSLPPTMTSCSCIKISYEMKVLITVHVYLNA